MSSLAVKNNVVKIGASADKTKLSDIAEQVLQFFQDSVLPYEDRDVVIDLTHTEELYGKFVDCYEGEGKIFHSERFYEKRALVFKDYDYVAWFKEKFLNPETGNKLRNAMVIYALDLWKDFNKENPVLDKYNNI